MSKGGGDDTDKLPVFRPQSAEPATITDQLHTIVPWTATRPEHAESMRWRCADGRWVSIAVGDGDELGEVIVSDSQGRRERVGSLEAALALAKEWRTWV